MNKHAAVAYFGNTVKLADALSITQAAVSQWGTVIPEKQALKLERLTEGALEYDPTLYKKAA